MEEQRDIAIQIEGLRKRYRLGVIGGGTLQGDIQSWWARKRGKEDPNSKIGAKVHAKNEEFYALDGIDLTIYKGERLGIIGHNGAGKSTLLKLLSRVTAPTEGKICIDGRISSMLEVGTGFNGELTGRENIYMNGAILGMSRAEVDSKIEDIIEFSECRQFIDTPVKRYSSGMYVKLAFAVAAHLDNEIMIMDEVLAVGDMAFQKKCLDKMSEVSKTQGRTILYVSHNMNTIRQLCDRCVVLNKGKIMYDGNVNEAIEFYIGGSDDSPAAVDLTKLKRTMMHASMGSIDLEQIRIIGKEQWILNFGEKMIFELTIKANKSLTGVGYRGGIRTIEGQAITVLLAPKSISIEKGERRTIRFEADISCLVPGKYYMATVLYGVNEYGGWEFYDHIDVAVYFEIVKTLGFNENMEWIPRYWGHVTFPQLAILEEKKIDE